MLNPTFDVLRAAPCCRISLTVYWKDVNVVVDVEEKGSETSGETTTPCQLTIFFGFTCKLGLIYCPSMSGQPFATWRVIKF